MALARDAISLTEAKKGLALVSPEEGTLLGRADLPPLVWDGLAVVPDRVLATTQDGQVICLGPAASQRAP